MKTKFELGFCVIVDIGTCEKIIIIYEASRKNKRQDFPISVVVLMFVPKSSSPPLLDKSILIIVRNGKSIHSKKTNATSPPFPSAMLRNLPLIYC